MLDMRYHIASLIAVFLALAIGILLGTVIVDKGVLVDQQKSLVTKIENNFAELRAENNTLKEEVTAQREFATQVIPLALKDRLTDKNVVVVATIQPEKDVLEKLIENIKNAGASANYIIIDNGFKVTDEILEQLKPYFPAPTQLKVENAKALMIKKMIEDLTINASTASASTSSTTTTTQKAPYLAILKNIGFIKTDLNLSGSEKAFNAAVLIGGANETRDPLQMDLPIILQFKALKINVVATESSEVKYSFIKDYQTAGVPTVDNINQPTGIISAIFALSGLEGNFGIKKTADQLMPTIKSQ